jgi:hypothetical protein
VSPKRIITDANGRQWSVHDFQIIAGTITKSEFGNGQYRGFAPLDGRARRYIMMFDRDRVLGTADDVLQSQLARSELWRHDDPELMARYGRTAERSDQINSD